jgi:hypothetical protein
MAKITVTAGAGRIVPIHNTVAPGPGGAHQLLNPGDELEVEDSLTLVQRSLRNGDLVVVEKPRVREAGERFSAAVPARPVAALSDAPPKKAS